MARAKGCMLEFVRAGWDSALLNLLRLRVIIYNLTAATSLFWNELVSIAELIRIEDRKQIWNLETKFLLSCRSEIWKELKEGFKNNVCRCSTKKKEKYLEVLYSQSKKYKLFQNNQSACDVDAIRARAYHDFPLPTLKDSQKGGERMLLTSISHRGGIAASGISYTIHQMAVVGDVSQQPPPPSVSCQPSRLSRFTSAVRNCSLKKFLRGKQVLTIKLP
jgi:hypothetical protein